MTEENKTRIEIPAGEYQKAKTAKGNVSRHNGDVVATALAGLGLNGVRAIAAEMTGIPSEELGAKYAHLNVGQQRMNLGNRIRGAVNKMNKHAESEAGQKEGAVTGDSYLEQIAEPHQQEAQARLQAIEEEKAAKAAERAAKAEAKEKAKKKEKAEEGEAA